VLFHSYKLWASNAVGTWNMSLMSAARSMTLFLPSGSNEIRQSLVLESLHPRRMTSPLRVTSQPCLWKNNSQPASASSDAVIRLFLMPGVLYASCACFGSLLSKRTKFSVEVNIGPLVELWVWTLFSGAAAWRVCLCQGVRYWPLCRLMR
jgi:hypothetical protein